MRLIVIEDNETIISSIKEVMELEFSEEAQNSTIFIKRVSEIPEALGNNIDPNDQYLVILDHELPDGTSSETIEALQNSENVWGNISKIYGFSSNPERQEEVVKKVLGESMSTIYEQSGKVHLFPLFIKIAQELSEAEGNEHTEEFARSM